MPFGYVKAFWKEQCMHLEREVVRQHNLYLDAKERLDQIFTFQAAQDAFRGEPTNLEALRAENDRLRNALRLISHVSKVALEKGPDA